MPVINIATVFNIELEFEAADVPRRVLAYLVDFTLLVLYFLLAKYILYGGGLANLDVLKSKVGIDILVISTPMLLYSLVCEIAMHGQTVGKKLLNVRVLSLDGKEPSVSQYLVRWMFRAFEWPFFFGYAIFNDEYLILYIAVTMLFGIGVVIAIGLTPKNQRLGDLAANTVVVKTKSDFTVKDTIFIDTDEDYQVQFPDVLKLSDRDINTINNILRLHFKDRRSDICERLAARIQAVLKIETDLEPVQFLMVLMKDYNYLANK